MIDDAGPHPQHGMNDSLGSADRHKFVNVTIPSAHLDIPDNFATMSDNVNSHRDIPNARSQAGQGASGNSINTGQSGRAGGYEKNTEDLATGHAQGAQTLDRGSVTAGQYGRAEEYQKHSPETNAGHNLPVDSAYAARGAERSGDSALHAEVKERAANGGRNPNDVNNPEAASKYDRSTTAEKALSDDAKVRIAKNEGNCMHWPVVLELTISQGKSENVTRKL
jgi:hypothetical protein